MDTTSTTESTSEATVIPAVYVPISELTSQHKVSYDESLKSLNNKMVRVIGILLSYDVLSSKLLIQDSKDPSKNLLVNTSKIEPFSFKKNCLFQFIGELDTTSVHGTQPILLKALLYRCVKELDMDVYEKAHSFRMSNLYVAN